MLKSNLVEFRAVGFSRFFQIATLSLLLCPSLSGHDFWIQPSTYSARPDTVLALSLRVGEDFHGGAFHRSSSHILRFFMTGPEGVQEVLGIEGKDPAGYGSIKDSGLYTVTYQSTPTFIEIAAEEFEQYLAEEGLESIIRLRSRREESHKPGRETYARCAKSLIWAAGTNREETIAQAKYSGEPSVPGCPLELIPEENPYLLPVGTRFPLRLFFRGRPLADALVTAIPKDAPELRISARTDTEGRLRLELSRPGPWLVKSVHMVPSTDSDRADWESFWASLTFELSIDGKLKK